MDPAQTVLQVVTLSFLRQALQQRRCAPLSWYPLDDVLSEREHINNMLRTRLDEVNRTLGRKSHQR